MFYFFPPGSAKYEDPQAYCSDFTPKQGTRVDGWRELASSSETPADGDTWSTGPRCWSGHGINRVILAKNRVILEMRQIIQEMNLVIPGMNRVIQEMNWVIPGMNLVIPEMNRVIQEMNLVILEMNRVIPGMYWVFLELNRVIPEMNRVILETGVEICGSVHQTLSDHLCYK